MDIEERLKLGNTSLKEKAINNEKIKSLVKGQSPFAMVITCSDSRVIPEKIFACDLGDIFVIRTAGNVINEGELASVEYGIEHLNIPYVLVLGHTHCGAVHAAIHNEKGKYLSPILSNIKRCIGDECNERKASIINALKQVDYLKERFPEYSGKIESALYDIETCEVIW